VIEEQDAAHASPVASGERIGSIDALRGFALLGILVMNIPFFALSQYTYPDPRHTGGFEGLDYLVWYVSELFFNMKMMAIFSMLFGAGMVIFSDRAASKGAAAGPLHYRRMAWLLLIGLVHAYAIWFGDILVPYVICGAAVFPLRRLSGRALVVLGPLVMLVAVLLNAPYGLVMGEAREAMLEAQSVVDAGGALTGAQQGALDAWVDEFEVFYPTPELLAYEADLRNNGGIDLLKKHARDTFFFETFGMLIWGIWRIGGLMLLGMGLYKLRVFDASRSLLFYGAMAAIGYGAGLPLVAAGVSAMRAHGFGGAEFFLTDAWWNYGGSVLVALGHVGLVLAVWKLGALRWLMGALAAVGRMALTNYLMQSIICTYLFYWWGLGLWGTMSRGELMLVVGAVWALQLVVSPIWLMRFRFGPMEWVWRSLTYWKRQPMLISGG